MNRLFRIVDLDPVVKWLIKQLFAAKCGCDFLVENFLQDEFELQHELNQSKKS